MKKIDWFKQWSYADNFFEDSFRDPTGEVWVKCDHPLSQKGWVVLKDLIVWELVGGWRGPHVVFRRSVSKKNNPRTFVLKSLTTGRIVWEGTRGRIHQG